MRFLSLGRGRRGYLLTAALAIAVAGGVLVGVGVAAQTSAPQPSASSARDPVTTIPAPTSPAPIRPTSLAGSASPASKSRTARTTAPAARPGLTRAAPTSISIPAIGVHAHFVQLGLAADGSIAVPSDVTHVGWYHLGPAPGQVGPAVVLGHVDSAKSGPGVFFKLGALSNGDTITVNRSDGRTVKFTVYAVREYPKDAFPTLTVYGNTADAQLRLITCGGSFDGSAGHYRSNVVVYARATPATTN
jgi:sortase (surface protein transpeptidase)